jgi:hypothetical protein
MTQTTIPNEPPDTAEADTGPHNVDAHMPPQPGGVERALSDPVYATPSWNPQTNEWSPSNEQHSVWGLAEPPHSDDPTADPMSESYGQVPSGTIPDARLNLIDSVRQSMTPIAPPPQEHHHVVEEVEKGSPIWRVRHVVVQSSTVPQQIVEENEQRKRVLLRIIPSDATVASTNPNLTAAPPPATLTVPAGKSWSLQSISFQYNAGAGVGNRNVQLTIRDAGGRILYQITDTTALTANQVENVFLAPGSPQQRTGAGPFAFNSSMPAITLAAGSTITASALGVDPSDTITNGVVMFALGSSAGVGQASLFISPRLSMSGQVAPQAWAKLIAGDAYLELKISEGIDAVVGNVGDISEVIIVEEIESTSGGLSNAPGAP